jgi:hypothetical protein
MGGAGGNETFSQTDHDTRYVSVAIDQSMTIYCKPQEMLHQDVRAEENTLAPLRIS